MVANYAKRPIPPYLHQNPSVQVRRKDGKRTKKGLANLFCHILKYLYFSMLRIF